jgi:hypothetical protein
MSTGSTLTWCNWAADATYLVVMNSSGIVSALLNSFGWNWIPVLDYFSTRKSIDHKYWPVTVKNHKLIYVLLNGENKPATHPQPVVSNAPLYPLIIELKDGKEKEKSSSANNLSKQLIWDSLKATHVTACLLEDNPEESLHALQQTCEQYEVS